MLTFFNVMALVVMAFVAGILVAFVRFAGRFRDDIDGVVGINRAGEDGENDQGTVVFSVDEKSSDE